MKIDQSQVPPRRVGLLRILAALSVSLAFTCFGAREGAAQSSLFSVPTTDVQPAGETYLEGDFDTHLESYAAGGYQSYGISAVYGARKGLEFGLNAYFTRTGPDTTQAELQPNLKWQAYSNEDSGVAAAAGAVFYIPANRGGGDVFAAAYAAVSKRVRGLRGARFTAGAYRLVGLDAGSGGASGAAFGYEQPLHHRLSFIADWRTGRNRLGYAAAGLGLQLTQRTSLYSAYYFGNEGRGNNSLGIYYGVSF